MSQTMKIEAKEISTFCPTNRQQWRDWLQEHHATEQSVWLIYHKKKSAISGISYNDAVDEALCFGWIDSRAKPIDEHTYMQFFGRRKPKSVWSKINKEKIQQLTDSGRMTQAGLNAIDVAKQNGSWTILDEVEALAIPSDLEEAFQQTPDAGSYFLGLSRSDKRAILQWLVLAKQSQTRQKRIVELIEQAAQRQKPPFIR
ncbi:YdeI/OmpD-associated family protein [Spirosoma sp. RP8]|uniref:YdeI/OmpD-associated family protein n=1 Tax=Spirosoma liriopis TaxID=2937440 RepID=A0ABT0HRA5_9BACT|nr:YdeI/OmpD-associated family protein [Spirosoma liriopis]MCK8494718.1 YdeI/OmpD-associated family protein [Spirosoma liriopis]